MADALAITRPFRMDLPAIERLLREVGLPAADLAATLDDYLVARRGERIVGAAGAEYRGRVALVRTVVVREAARGQGVGRALVEALLADARRMQAEYLLAPAHWAPEFFTRLGFAPLSERTGVAEDAALLPADGAYLVRPVGPA